MNDDITITTCLYDIRAKEGGDKETTRSLSNYIELGNHMLQVRLPMIIYTDSEEVREKVSLKRTEYGLGDKTTIVWLPFEETSFYKDMDMLQERMRTFELNNWNREKDTPLYVTLNNNKFDFLRRTMSSNPYGSSFFFWMDFGIQHCAQASDEDWDEVSEKWADFIRKETDLIHHLRIHTVQKPEDCSFKDYFRMIYHHIAGSFFGGHEKPLREYIELYTEEWENIIYFEEWWQLDEAVMTIVVEKHPERFRLYYGDYDGLITNFMRTTRSWHLVFQTAQRHLDARNYKQSEQVLATMDETMTTFSSDDPMFQKYLAMRICNDYYRWDGAFSTALQDILFSRRRVADLKGWLANQIHNLRFYTQRLPENMRLSYYPNEIFEHITPPARFLMRWSFFDQRNQHALEKWKGLYHEEGKGQWIGVGDRCVSAMAIFENHMRTHAFPLDYVQVSPSQLRSLFHDQFYQFYDARQMTDDYTNRYGIRFEHHEKRTHHENEPTFERRVRRFYQFLEEPPSRLVFLHTTESFLWKELSPDEQCKYDQDLVHICRYMSRNFPKLDFVFLSLYLDREISIPQDELPPNMVVIMMHTPFEFSKHRPQPPQRITNGFRESIYEWLWCMKNMVSKNEWGEEQEVFKSPIYRKTLREHLFPSSSPTD